jgi:hypothetical protein
MTILLGMMWRGYTKKLLALLLVFALQAQLLAAAVLPCAHSLPEHSPDAATLCPQHHAERHAATDATPPSRFDCHKCALTCLCGAPAAPLPTATQWLNLTKPLTGSVPITHFYRFIAAPGNPPPIATPS